MTFFCYIYSHGCDVPHMEALDSLTLSSATARSSRMLREHRAAVRAEVFENDQRVAIISLDEVVEQQRRA